jgi:hypothetical protein
VIACGFAGTGVPATSAVGQRRPVALIALYVVLGTFAFRDSPPVVHGESPHKALNLVRTVPVRSDP